MTLAVILTASSTARDQLSAVIHSVVWRAENQLHLLVNNPGPDAFACIGTFYAQHADRIVAEHEVPIGHRVSSQALS